MLTSGNELDNSDACAAYVAKRKRRLVKPISGFHKERPTIVKEEFCHNHVSVDSRYNLQFRLSL